MKVPKKAILAGAGLAAAIAIGGACAAAGLIGETEFRQMTLYGTVPSMDAGRVDGLANSAEPADPD